MRARERTKRDHHYLLDGGHGFEGALKGRLWTVRLVLARAADPQAATVRTDAHRTGHHANLPASTIVNASVNISANVNINITWKGPPEARRQQGTRDKCRRGRKRQVSIEGGGGRRGTGGVAIKNGVNSTPQGRSSKWTGTRKPSVGEYVSYKLTMT